MTNRICSVAGCGRTAKGGTYPTVDGPAPICGSHAYRYRTYGNVRAEVPIARHYSSKTGVCAVDGCVRTTGGLLCNAHTSRLWRRGDVNADVPVRIPVEYGLICSVANCGRIMNEAGLCSTHYSRQHRTGSGASRQTNTRASTRS